MAAGAVCGNPAGKWIGGHYGVLGYEALHGTEGAV
jgi:hypothetical protein